MTDDGWVKTHRKISRWEWYKEPHMFHLFTHLVISANHKDGRWKGREVKRGQLITGLNSLCGDTGISIRSLRTCLERLKKSGEIDIKATNKYSLITICKYDDYNSDRQTEIENETNERQTSDKRATTNKNVKNDKNVKKTRSIIEFVPPSVDDVKAFFAENGYMEAAAVTAWKYYGDGNWFDSKGNQVKNWKQKMRMVWFTDKNKIVEETSQQTQMVW